MQIIIAVVFGGRRTILGGILGSIFLVLFDELLRPIGQLNTFVVSGVALLRHLVPAGRRPRLRAAPAGGAMNDAAPPLFGGLLQVRASPSGSAGWSRRSDIAFSDPRRRDPRAYRAQRLGQIDGDAADHGHREAQCRQHPAGRHRYRRLADPPDRAKGIGIVFQHSRPLNRQTVLENIKLALLPDSLFRLAVQPHVEERARAIAERVGLGAVLGRRPPTLPFADLRRLEMAKALARDPKVVLIDEPFAGLTQGEIAIFSELIDGFRREGHAVLLVDHNVKSVAALVDRVLAMYLGERIAEGTADEVMHDQTVRRVYLGGEIETHPRPELDARRRRAAARRPRRRRALWQGAGAAEGLAARAARASSSPWSD